MHRPATGGEPIVHGFDGAVDIWHVLEYVHREHEIEEAESVRDLVDSGVVDLSVRHAQLRVDCSSDRRDDVEAGSRRFDGLDVEPLGGEERRECTDPGPDLEEPRLPVEIRVDQVESHTALVQVGVELPADGLGFVTAGGDHLGDDSRPIDGREEPLEGSFAFGQHRRHSVLGAGPYRRDIRGQRVRSGPMGSVAVAPVAVVGSGAAGLMAACVASEQCRTVLVTDRGLGTSNSAVAQGGLQLPDADAASLESFRRDVERSGGEGIDPDRLDVFVREVRPTVELLQAWGLELDRGPDGTLVRRRAGGMSQPRVVTSGDRIGAALLKVLRNRVTASGVETMLHHRVVDLVPLEAGLRLVFDGGESLDARSVVLAVGGGAHEHALATGVPTSNPANRNTGLYDVVRRLGVAEVDAGLFQYQPYGIVHPTDGVTGKCVPESVVELGAAVVDVTGGRVAPPHADRRQLTDAMFAAIADGRGEQNPSGVVACRLTLGSLDPQDLAARYPRLERMLDGARLSTGDIHVVPVLHYQLGGFVVGPDGSTCVPGLFLAGEMAGGLHGQNRLMGNGITEAVVSGRLAGAAAARVA